VEDVLPMIGKTVALYEITSPRGKGGMGEMTVFHFLYPQKMD
jgi:hypothetical protein